MEELLNALRLSRQMPWFRVSFIPAAHTRGDVVDRADVEVVVSSVMTPLGKVSLLRR